MTKDKTFIVISKTAEKSMCPDVRGEEGEVKHTCQNVSVIVQRWVWIDLRLLMSYTDSSEDKGERSKSSWAGLKWVLRVWCCEGNCLIRSWMSLWAYAHSFQRFVLLKLSSLLSLTCRHWYSWCLHCQRILLFRDLCFILSVQGFTPMLFWSQCM